MLIEKNGADRALDRMHTVLHAFLKNICDENKIIYSDNDSITALFKKIRENLPIFSQKDEKIENVLNSLANIIDKLNTIRNNKSLAHANKNLLDNNEANLVIDSINTILRYLIAKTEKN